MSRQHDYSDLETDKNSPGYLIAELVDVKYFLLFDQLSVKFSFIGNSRRICRRKWKRSKTTNYQSVEDRWPALK